MYFKKKIAAVLPLVMSAGMATNLFNSSILMANAEETAVMTEGVSICGVKAFRFGSDALHVDSSYDVKIEKCHFGTLGHSGIRLTGGDRKTLSPSGYTPVRDGK